ncbi:hypothetical protein AVEN_20145-1 [Araneus ventricosus]|uniref:C2H2-type domain-containing protein n=1 Tax=Araneus ventricosus TaxID=182803 RepID=A0A4Y2T299_ARAVE|nr:hypothetical protein AVEN_20145-1 [Araneus ventricosus]
MNDWPPRLHRALWPLIIVLITSSSCDDPLFYWGMTHHRRWALRATPPLYPPGNREPAYLYDNFSSTNSRCDLCSNAFSSEVDLKQHSLMHC